MKLSILICSLESRKKYLQLLLGILNFKCSRLYDVEILVSSDDGMITTGEKRNVLLEESRGEYIAFVDDDDVVSDNYVELILKAIESKPDVVGIHLLLYDDGKHTGLAYHSLKYDSWWDEPNKDNPSLRNYYRNPNHINPVKREHAVATMFPHITIGEDRQYSMGILKYLKSEVYIEEPIYFYLCRSVK